MKEDFETLYFKLIEDKNSNLYELWENVKKSKIRIIVFMVMCLLASIFIIYFKIINYNLIKVVGIIDVALFVVLIIKIDKNQKKFNAEYKKNIIEKLLCNFFSDVNYKPNLGISKQIYNEGKYKEYYNRYYSDDYIECKFKEKYLVQMADIHTVKETYSKDANGNTTKEETTIFQGLFAKIKLNKSINTDIVIGKNILLNGKNKLEMDSIEFEKYFDVNTTDNMITMQILTPDVIECLNEIRKDSKNKIDISIFNDAIYVRINSGKMFETKVKLKNVIDKTRIEKDFYTLKYIEEILSKFCNSIENL